MNKTICKETLTCNDYKNCCMQNACKMFIANIKMHCLKIKIGWIFSGRAGENVGSRKKKRSINLENLKEFNILWIDSELQRKE